MWAKEADEALVLSQTEKGEADRVFTVFTRQQGKLNLLAKGERKILSKLRRGIDLFYLTRVTFVSTTVRNTLTDVDLINDFPVLRQDWRKFQVVSWLSRLVDFSFPSAIQEEEVFSLLRESWEDLEKTEKYFQRPYYYFLWQFFKILGYQPEILFSSSKHKIFVSGIEGMFSNQTRQPKNACLIDPSSRSWLRLILRGEKKTFYRQPLSPAEEKNLKKISQLYFSFLSLGRDGGTLGFRL